MKYVYTYTEERKVEAHFELCINKHYNWGTWSTWVLFQTSQTKYWFLYLYAHTTENEKHLSMNPKMPWL